MTNHTNGTHDHDGDAIDMWVGDGGDGALDRPHEECGVFGIYAPGEDVSRLTYFGLYALQHRGQESAGIACGDGARLLTKRDMGLVSQVFDEESLLALRGRLAIGHTRYSTTGSSNACNAQPVILGTGADAFALGHNGNLVNTLQLRERLVDDGVRFDSTSDSEIIARMIAAASGPHWTARIARTLPKLMGAYSLVMATPTEIFAARDPLGVRPLCLGRLGDGWVVASETCALDTIGATFEREIAPGEMVRIDASGLSSHRFAVNRPALCAFEYIYFARPDSLLRGTSIYMARLEMGRRLAAEHPADADVVMAIPDSAVPGGIGYSQASGLPYVEGLIKNRYIGRTFISPDQSLRARSVHLKFNPVVELLAGKRVVVVDDSIVRGTTTPRIVSLLRESGAREVHVRITSPPITDPCYLGVDMATYDELIAANHTVDEIRAIIGADSLGFLSKEALLGAVARQRSEMCLGCLTGEYPVKLSTPEYAFASPV